MNKFYFFTIFVLIFFYTLPAKSSAVDSLNQILKNENNPAKKVQLLLDIGFEYESNNKTKSIEYYNRALEIARKNNDHLGIGNAFNYLCIVQKDLGEYKTALENGLKARLEFETIGNKSKEASVNNNIGLIYYSLNDFDKARHFLFSCLNYKEKEHDTSGIISVCNNIGINYEGEKKYDSALYYYEKVGRLNQSSHNPEDQAMNLNNIGNIYLFRNQFDSAIVHYRQSLDILQKLGRNALVGAAYINIAQVYYRLDNQKLSKENVKKSLPYLMKAQQNKYLSVAYNLLSELALQKNNFKEAYYYLDSTFSIFRHIYTENNTRTIAELQSKYDLSEQNYKVKMLEKDNKLLTSQKFSQEIALSSLVIFVVLSVIILIIYSQKLKIQKQMNQLLEENNIELIQVNRKITESESELQKLNESKDKFLSMMAHDIKNPLSSLVNVTEVLENYFNELSDDEKIEFVRDINQSSVRLRNMLEDLLEWSRVQMGVFRVNNEKFDLRYIVENQITFIKSQADKKSITIKSLVGKGISLDSDVNIVATILRNLLSNAVKFTNAGGEVLIEHYQKDDLDYLVVKDNGIGIDEKTQEKLFRIGEYVTTPGTMNERGTGLGLILCKELAGMIGSELILKSKTGEGSTFTFSIINKSKKNFEI